MRYAHNWCKESADMALRHGDGGHDVVVSNTFTQLWELQPYLDMAKKYHRDVTVYKMTSQYKSVHGVPDEVIAKMAARWEDFEGEELI